MPKEARLLGFSRKARLTPPFSHPGISDRTGDASSKCAIQSVATVYSCDTQQQQRRQPQHLQQGQQRKISQFGKQKPQSHQWPLEQNCENNEKTVKAEKNWFSVWRWRMISFPCTALLVYATLFFIPYFFHYLDNFQSAVPVTSPLSLKALKRFFALFSPPSVKYVALTDSAASASANHTNTAADRSSGSSLASSSDTVDSASIPASSAAAPTRLLSLSQPLQQRLPAAPVAARSAFSLYSYSRSTAATFRHDSAISFSSPSSSTEHPPYTQALIASPFPRSAAAPARSNPASLPSAGPTREGSYGGPVFHAGATAFLTEEAAEDAVAATAAEQCLAQYGAASTLVESSGLYGKSYLREFDFCTGTTLRQVYLHPSVFAEGVAYLWEPRERQLLLLLLTWKEKLLIVLHAESWNYIGALHAPFEGWGLASSLSAADAAAAATAGAAEGTGSFTGGDQLLKLQRLWVTTGAPALLEVDVLSLLESVRNIPKYASVVEQWRRASVTSAVSSHGGVSELPRNAAARAAVENATATDTVGADLVGAAAERTDAVEVVAPKAAGTTVEAAEGDWLLYASEKLVAAAALTPNVTVSGVVHIISTKPLRCLDRRLFYFNELEYLPYRKTLLGNIYGENYLAEVNVDTGQCVSLTSLGGLQGVLKSSDPYERVMNGIALLPSRVLPASSSVPAGSLHPTTGNITQENLASSRLSASTDGLSLQTLMSAGGDFLPRSFTSPLTYLLSILKSSQPTAPASVSSLSSSVSTETAGVINSTTASSAASRGSATTACSLGAAFNHDGNACPTAASAQQGIYAASSSREQQHLQIDFGKFPGKLLVTGKQWRELHLVDLQLLKPTTAVTAEMNTFAAVERAAPGFFHREGLRHVRQM